MNDSKVDGDVAEAAVGAQVRIAQTDKHECLTIHRGCSGNKSVVERIMRTTEVPSEGLLM